MHFLSQDFTRTSLEVDMKNLSCRETRLSCTRHASHKSTYQGDIPQYQRFHDLSNTILRATTLEGRENVLVFFRGTERVYLLVPDSTLAHHFVFLSGEWRNTNPW